MKTFNFEQGTPEWLECRLGRATASNYDRILTPTGKTSAQREEYACELIAEELCGGRDPWRESYQSADMAHGTFTEAEARKFAAFTLDVDIEQVGFCLHENEFWGGSPDGLINPDSGIEIKCPKASTHLRYFLDGIVPPCYRPQVHGSLIVTGRPSWWFLSYSLGLPPLLVEVKPDAYTDQLRAALDEFTKLHAEIRARVIAARDVAIDAEIDRRQDQPTKKMQSFVTA